MALGRYGLAAFFVLDVADTVAWLSRILPGATAWDHLTVSVVAGRTLIASAEGMAAWLLVRREPAASMLAFVGLLGAAIFTTFIVGLGLAPSDVPPGARSWFVAIYWAVAVVGLGLVRRLDGHRARSERG